MKENIDKKDKSSREWRYIIKSIPNDKGKESLERDTS